MATTAQVLANQRNAQLSTGPRTTEGKTASRSNAIKHGLSATAPVLPHEDPAAFQLLLQQCRADWDPKSANEQFLVNQLAAALWKLDRIERLELEMFNALSGPDPSNDKSIVSGLIDANKAAAFSRLDRHRTNLERTYHRSLRALRLAQKERKAIEKEQNEANQAELKQKQVHAAAAKLYEHQQRMRRNRGSAGGGYLFREDEEDIDGFDEFSAAPNNGRAPGRPDPAA